MKLLLLIYFLSLPMLLLGQTGAVPAIGEKAADKADSLWQPARGVIQRKDSSLLYVQHQIDSAQEQLQTIQHPLHTTRTRVEEDFCLQDSLEQVLQKGQELHQKLERDKEGVAAPLEKALGVSAPSPAALVPQAELPDLGQTTISILPQMVLLQQELSMPAVPGEADFMPLTGPSAGLFSEEKLAPVGLLQQDSSTFSGAAIDEQVEAQLLKQEKAGAVQEQLDVGEDPLKDFLSMDGQALAKDAAIPEESFTQPLPIDHFAGREKELQKAKEELLKHKQRFSEVENIKDLSKNPLKRHPLRGVIWHKRVQPGLQWQFGLAETFRADIGPRVTYLVTDKLEIGAAYQERLVMGKVLPGFFSFDSDRIWGYSITGSHEIKKGFYGQFSYERLNTRMQQLPHQQERPEQRLWTEGVCLGLGKGYTIHKSLKGYTLIEYNFSRSLHAPYRQQLQVKAGLMWGRKKH